MNGEHAVLSTGKRRIYILDDHPLVREWLTGLIAAEADLEACGQAEDPSTALAGVRATRPDLVIVDLSLPRGSGLEFIKDLRAQHPATRVLVLSMHDEASVAERAVRAGAHGYVVKRESAAHIIEAIRAVLAGKFHASPSLSAEIAGRLLNRSVHAGGSPAELLSDRELDVFRLRGLGRSTKEIADSLGVSVKTVGAYETRIREKLGLQDSGELLREAVLWHERRRSV